MNGYAEERFRGPWTGVLAMTAAKTVVAAIIAAVTTVYESNDKLDPAPPWTSGRSYRGAQEHSRPVPLQQGLL